MRVVRESMSYGHFGFGTRGRLGRRGKLGNFGTLGSLGRPLPAYCTPVARAMAERPSTDVLHSPEPARARIVAAIEQIACIAVSLLIGRRG